MTAIKKLYEFAALSQAAYGFLPERPTDRQAQEVLVRTLETDIGEENRFVLSQAQRLIGATGYSVLHHQANDSWGFSAMVVRDNCTGGKSIVFRGTEAGPTEIDTLGSNVQIAVAGVARDQIFSMWNYYQRLIAPEGAPVAQWVPTPASPNPAFPIASPVRPYSLVSGAATGLGVLTPGEQVDLAGHSLGGAPRDRVFEALPRGDEAGVRLQLRTRPAHARATPYRSSRQCHSRRMWTVSARTS